MSDLQKMKDDKLDLFIEHIEKELESLEFKLQVISISGIPDFSYGTEHWDKYYYYLTVLLQVAKEEKRKRTKRVKHESK